MKIFTIVVALLLTMSCSVKGPRVNVYGHSGKVFTAPDICAALVACQNTGETACYYNNEMFTMSNGQMMEIGCKEVTK